jgi:hypothetical protein
VCSVAVQWLRRLVAGLSPRRHVFDPRPARARFMLEKVALGQVCLIVFRFSLVNNFQPMLHTCPHLHVALTRRMDSRILETLQRATVFRKSGSIGQKSTFLSLVPVQWLRRLVDGLLPRRTDFDPASVHVRLVADGVALDRVFFEYFSFPLPISFHQCSVLIFIYMLLLPEGQTGEAWEPFEKQSSFSEIGEHWIEKNLYCFCLQTVNITLFWDMAPCGFTSQKTAALDPSTVFCQSLMYLCTYVLMYE